MHDKTLSLDEDISLNQLMLAEDGSLQSKDLAVDSLSVQTKKSKKDRVQFLHPSSLESALSMMCAI
jgi:hypothetical protein